MLAPAIESHSGHSTAKLRLSQTCLGMRRLGYRSSALIAAFLLPLPLTFAAETALSLPAAVPTRFSLCFCCLPHARETSLKRFKIKLNLKLIRDPSEIRRMPPFTSRSGSVGSSGGTAKLASPFNRGRSRPLTRQDK